jgi:hypothetical protein
MTPLPEQTGSTSTSSPSQGTPDDRVWTTQIVDFVAEILRGEIEIETTIRGDTPVSVRHSTGSPRLGARGLLLRANRYKGERFNRVGQNQPRPPTTLRSS